MMPGMKKILFFPLSNVLGHLTRTLALAEEFDAQGHEVYIAMHPTYSYVTKVLPPSIRILPTPEMYADTIQSFGLIQHYPETIANDRANLESCWRIEESDLRRRRERMKLMVDRDTAIVEEVRPDAIITDYRFTTQFVQHRQRQRAFHISHVIGYLSFYRRVMGSDFFPLSSGHILVPGVRNIEYWKRSPTHPDSQRRETICGYFRWAGWRRLHRDAPTPPPSNVFLFFGSTGNGRQIVPWFLQNIPERYRISTIAPGMNDGGARGGAYFSNSGELERFLNTTEVAFCHGGHGTVMECILHRTPMAIFPHNIEQLEIGRHIEKMRLGILVKRPYNQLNGEDLGAIIEELKTNARIRINLEKYSRVLRQLDGPKNAVSTVLQSLANGSVPSS